MTSSKLSLLPDGVDWSLPQIFRVFDAHPVLDEAIKVYRSQKRPTVPPVPGESLFILYFCSRGFVSIRGRGGRQLAAYEVLLAKSERERNRYVLSPHYVFREPPDDRQWFRTGDDCELPPPAKSGRRS